MFKKLRQTGSKKAGPRSFAQKKSIQRATKISAEKRRKRFGKSVESLEKSYRESFDKPDPKSMFEAMPHIQAEERLGTKHLVQKIRDTKTHKGFEQLFSQVASDKYSSEPSRLAKAVMKRSTQEIFKDKGMSSLKKKYPKAIAEVTKESQEETKREGSPYVRATTLHSVAGSKNPKVELEKAIVYKMITDNGPDVNFARLGKKLAKIRKFSGDILKAHGSKDGVKLYDALVKAKLVESFESDDLRDDGDKFY